METPLSPEALLEHRDFLRSLARRLIFDDDAAADLEQETWLALVRRPPDCDRPARPWIARVARNLAWRSLRTESRRATREHSAPRPAPVPSPDEIVAREAVRRRLLDAVLELETRYREVVLLRYYEDLPAREIARRLDVPLETVRTRLRRGLGVLRARLTQDADGDDWRFSLSILIAPFGPLARDGWRSNLVPGAIAMAASIKTGLLVALVVLVALGGWWWIHEDPRDSDVELLDLPAEAESSRRSLASLEGPQGGLASAEELSGAGISETQKGPGRGAGPGEDQGRRFVDRGEGVPLPNLFLEVRNEGGDLVPGAEVRARSEGAEGYRAERLSDEQGEVRLRVPNGELTVQVDEDGWYCRPMTIVVGRSEAPERFVVVVEKMARLRGVVLDHLGRPLPGARVWCEEKWTDDEGTSHRWTSEWRRSDARGEFLLDEVVFRSEAECSVQAKHPSYVDVARTPAVVVRSQLAEVSPVQFHDPGASIEARVFQPDGRPAAGASAVLMREDEPEARSSEVTAAGDLRISGLRAGAHRLRLRAADGSLATRSFTLAADTRRNLGSIVLDPPVHRLTGRVLTPDDEGAGGARLTIESPSWDGADVVRATADASGRFEIAAGDAGPFRLTVEWTPPGEPLASIENHLGEFELEGSREIRLRPGGLLLEPREASTGEPIRGWRGFIVAFPPDELGAPTNEATSRNGITNEGWQLRWLANEELRPGEWRFEITLDGYRPVTVSERLPSRVTEEIRVPLRLERIE